MASEMAIRYLGLKQISLNNSVYQMDISKLPNDIIRYISEYVHLRQPRGFDTVKGQMMAARIRRLDVVFSLRKIVEYECWLLNKYIKSNWLVGRICDSDDINDRSERYECWFETSPGSHIIASGSWVKERYEYDYDDDDEEQEPVYYDGLFLFREWFKLDLTTNTWQSYTENHRDFLTIVYDIKRVNRKKLKIYDDELPLLSLCRRVEE
jgi:hypothetical protein